MTTKKTDAEKDAEQEKAWEKEWQKDHTNIKCTKCGLTANSKCPFCRNIFYIQGGPDRPYAKQMEVTALENVIGGDRILTPVGYKEGYKERHITIRLRAEKTPEEGESWEDTLTDERLLELVKWIGSSDQLHFALCNHTWEFKPGEVSEIDCGHGSKRRKRGKSKS